MAEFDTAHKTVYANRSNGRLPIPSSIQEKMHIKPGTALSRINWGEKGEHVLLVPEGAEIVLADRLVGGGDILRDARILTPSTKIYFSSLANRNEFDKRPSVHMGSVTGIEMAVIPVEEGLMITPNSDALTVYESLPRCPDLTWLRTPDVSPGALADSYASWIEKRGKEAAGAISGKNSLTPVVGNDTGLEGKILRVVREDIFKAGASQLRRSR